MKFYAYYKVRIPSNGRSPGAIPANTASVILHIALSALAKKGNAKSIVELHLCKELLNGIANEFGSKVEFADGERCFSCNGIGIWCDDSLANDEMVVVCE